jgi:hypothetical protein
LWGGKDPYRAAEDVAFAVARFFQAGGVFQNYYMVSESKDKPLPPFYLAVETYNGHFYVQLIIDIFLYFPHFSIMEAPTLGAHQEGHSL